MGIVVKGVKDVNGAVIDAAFTSEVDLEIEGNGLLLLPALIDPHVHFRIPGAAHKEDWITGARAAVKGGVTTVFDMPNNTPSCTTLDTLLQKQELIEQQLKEAQIPLRYALYLGADKSNIDEIAKAKDYAIGLKIFMGSSTGDLLIDDDAVLDELFRIAGDLDMLISVHAEDEPMVQENKRRFEGQIDPAVHSKIRTPEAAAKAVDKAISLAAKYGNRLCILHMSTKAELDLVRKGKQQGIKVFAETSPHHLFLTVNDYAQWGNYVVVNPPIRDPEDQASLWDAIKDGTIDFIGTDHAPHLRDEKAQPYGKAPAGIASIELYLPLLLDAISQNRLSLQRLVELTRTNIEKIFQLPANDDAVLIDMSLLKEVEDHSLKTKCGWSPYRGRKLKGWPAHTIIKGQVFSHAASHL